MPFPVILAQDAPRALLRALVAEGRMPHAALLQGPAGVGKTTTALSVARALLCERGAPSGEACGACRACRLAGRLTHPDLLVVVPTEREESESAEEVGPTLERMRTALDARLSTEFYEPRYPKAASIGIGVVRFYVQAELSKRPVETPRRVVVIAEADRLTQSAQNALLKTLEEPPAYAHLLLVSARPESLADTVRSRCRAVRFGEVPRAALAAMLRETQGVDPAAARLAAGLASGSVPRAVRLAGEALDAARRDALALIRAARTRNPSEAARLARSVVPAGERDRERLHRLAELALLWYEDVLLVRSGAPDDRLAHSDLAGEVRREAASASGRAIAGRIRALEDLRAGLERNLQPKLLVATTIIRMADAEAA